jgi:hypothetical protein
MVDGEWAELGQESGVTVQGRRVVNGTQAQCVLAGQ